MQKARIANEACPGNRHCDPPMKHNHPSGACAGRCWHGGPNHYPSAEQTNRLHILIQVMQKEICKHCPE